MNHSDHSEGCGHVARQQGKWIIFNFNWHFHCLIIIVIGCERLKCHHVIDEIFFLVLVAFICKVFRSPTRHISRYFLCDSKNFNINGRMMKKIMQMQLKVPP